MDHAHPQLENGLESFYDRVRRPFERLRLNLAVTQNYLQAQADALRYFLPKLFSSSVCHVYIIVFNADVILRCIHKLQIPSIFLPGLAGPFQPLDSRAFA